jgi:hypothetical protein
MPVPHRGFGTPSLLAVFLLGSWLLAGEAKAQDRSVRPVFGAAPVWITVFGGDAWEGMDGGAGVSALAGIRMGPWRAALAGTASGHNRDTGLTREMDLLAFSAELRRNLPIHSFGAWAHVGTRVGLVHQEFDTSTLAVLEIDLVPGTEVTEEDTGVIFGPVAGVTLPVGGPLEIDVSGSYRWADVTPYILGPEAPEPGLSTALSLSAWLLVRI